MLSPGRFVGAAESEDESEGFEDKMYALAATLERQFAESARLEKVIRANLEGAGFIGILNKE